MVSWLYHYNGNPYTWKMLFVLQQVPVINPPYDIPVDHLVDVDEYH